MSNEKHYCLTWSKSKVEKENREIIHPFKNRFPWVRQSLAPTLYIFFGFIGQRGSKRKKEKKVFSRHLKSSIEMLTRGRTCVKTYTHKNERQAFFPLNNNNNNNPNHFLRLNCVYDDDGGSSTRESGGMRTYTTLFFLFFLFFQPTQTDRADRSHAPVQ